MPFCSELTLQNPTNSNAMLGNLCREYYQGALIAADSLSAAGLSLQISVFDTENDSLVLVGLLKKQAIKDADLIIGPVLQGGNKVMSEFTKGKELYHVSPLMTFSKTKIQDPNFVAANPSLPYYAKLVIDHIKSVDPSGTIVVVSDKSSLDKTITTAIKQLQATQKVAKIRLVDYTIGMDVQPYIAALGNTHFILPTSSEATVKGFLHGVKDTSMFRTVSVYGFPQWLDFKSPEYVLWQQAHVRIATPFFIDYEHPEVKHFVSAYRERFYTEPTEAAFKGYDQLLFFGSGISNGGSKFLTKADTSNALHTTFKFTKQEDKSGFQNMFLNIIAIEQLRWVKKN